MRLQKLILNNFKGIEYFTLEPNGKSIQVFGDNGTGKTSLADAMTWLLIDKDTQDKSPTSFGLKTRDEHGEHIHGLEHKVCGHFELEDGSTIVLEKIYKENWVTKRGTTESRLENHTTDYYWSEEPVSASEYKSRVTNIMTEEQFKILTIVNYFPELLHWTKRRELLIQLIGSVDTEQIVDAYPELNGYLELLDDRSREAVEKILRDKKSRLNKELDNIPSRIDENQNHIKNVDGLEEAKESIKSLSKDKQQYEDQLAEIRSGGGVSDLNVKVQEIEAQKSKRENAFRKELDTELSDQREKVSELEDKVDESGSALRSVTRSYQETKERLDTAEAKAEHIQSLIEKEKAKQPEPKQEAKDPMPCPMGCPPECPECGADLLESPKKDDGNYDEYLKEFNNNKAEKIKLLTADLTEEQARVDTIAGELKDLESDGAKARAKDSQRKEALQKYKNTLQAMKNQQPSISDDAEYTKLEKQKQALLDRISEIKSSRQGAVDDVQERIDTINDEMEEHHKVVQQAKANQQYRDRIKELQDEQRQHAKKLEEIESGLNLIDTFKKAEADYITDKVNDYFEIVNFRLFEPQVNGGVKEVCDCMVDGVPYSEGLNTGSRIKAGLDIIETMSRLLFKKEAPVWIDNAESITQLPDSDLQLLSTIVSKDDASLRVEYADQPERVEAVA